MCVITLLTSDAQGTDSSDANEVWSHTDVKNSNPACTKVMKIHAKNMINGYKFARDMQASIQTQWWSLPGTWCEQILQYRPPPPLSPLLCPYTFFDSALLTLLQQSFAYLDVMTLVKSEARSLTIYIAYEAPSRNIIRHKFSQGDLKR